MSSYMDLSGDAFVHKTASLLRGIGSGKIRGKNVVALRGKYHGSRCSECINHNSLTKESTQEQDYASSKTHP
jgi:hypothetical protein